MYRTISINISKKLAISQHLSKVACCILSESTVTFESDIPVPV